MFSSRGMVATTREIADAAGVNEVTLFRLFESKERLLAAVVREVVRAESEALDLVDLEDFDIHRDISRVAQVFYDTHHRYQAFLRTILAHRMQPKLTEEIVREVIQPLREKFIRYLAEGQRRGIIRRNLDLTPAVDAFTGMIFAAVLRRAVGRGGFTPPDPDGAADLYETTQAVLEAAGFDAYEVSNHARGAAARSRHNLIYWQGQDYVGAGPGAHGRITDAGGRQATLAAARPADYIARVADTGLGFVKREALSPYEAALERMLSGLRIRDGVSMVDLAALALPPSRLAAFVEMGLIADDPAQLRATDAGRLVLDRLTLELAG